MESGSTQPVLLPPPPPPALLPAPQDAPPLRMPPSYSALAGRWTRPSRLWGVAVSSQDPGLNSDLSPYRDFSPNTQRGGRAGTVRGRPPPSPLSLCPGGALGPGRLLGSVAGGQDCSVCRARRHRPRREE